VASNTAWLTPEPDGINGGQIRGSNRVPLASTAKAS
jgi:hypothetical protein